jgi:hypothetical protein
MDEIPLRSPAAKVAFAKRAAGKMWTFHKTYFGDWQRIIINSILLLLLVLFVWAGFQPFSRIPSGARKKESAIMGVGLANSIEQFHADYGRLPLSANGATATGDMDTDTGEQPGLVAVLIGKEPLGSNLQNPRATNYLEGLKPAKRGKNADGPPWVNGLIYELPSQLAVVDAWGNHYHVRMDTNGEGFIENPCPDEVAEGRALLKQLVIVWSPGKDGHEETWEDNPKSWD